MKVEEGLIQGCGARRSGLFAWALAFVFVGPSLSDRGEELNAYVNAFKS